MYIEIECVFAQTFQRIHSAIHFLYYTLATVLTVMVTLVTMTTAINEIFKMLNGPLKWSYILDVQICSNAMPYFQCTAFAIR